MDAVLYSAQRCAKLASLNIAFPTGIVLDLVPESWELLPPSLTHLRYSSGLEDHDDLGRLIRRLWNLDLRDFPSSVQHSNHLVHLLCKCPHLEVLRLPLDDHEYVELLCSEDPGFPDPTRRSVSILKKRFLAPGLQLRCSRLCIYGTAEQVKDLLSWLPPFPDISNVKLIFCSDEQENCLQNLSRVFPNVRGLILGVTEEGRDAWLVGSEFLRPLGECATLQSLYLCLDLTLTGPQLRELCTSPPQLTRFNFHPCQADQKSELRSGLKELGREIVVEPFSVWRALTL